MNIFLTNMNCDSIWSELLLFDVRSIANCDKFIIYKILVKV